MEERITQSDIRMIKAVIREMQCDLEEQQEILNKLETGIRLKRDNKRRLEVILDSFLDEEELWWRLILQNY